MSATATPFARCRQGRQPLRGRPLPTKLPHRRCTTEELLATLMQEGITRAICEIGHRAHPTSIRPHRTPTEHTLVNSARPTCTHSVSPPPARSPATCETFPQHLRPSQTDLAETASDPAQQKGAAQATPFE